MKNQIFNENCLATMALMPREYVDMVLTSPPYDGIRTYNGYTFEFEPIARELYRVVKEGGVVVWVVNDQTIDGSETGTSFKQALYFMDVGFKLNDTMIFLKTNPLPAVSDVRYYSAFEYMFVFSKGKPKTFNALTGPRSNQTGDRRRWRHLRYGRNAKGEMPQGKKFYEIKEIVRRTNVWEYPIGFNNNTTDKKAYKHPAIFPEALAQDHILTWSNRGDVVYDPFMGSGTTAKMAIANGRDYIGSEISAEYCEVIKKRLERVQGVLI